MHMNERGITLRHGRHAGRLLRASRDYVKGNAPEHRGEHYTNAIYSDDGGSTWKTSAPFPATGTGEAAIVELSDGRILYNSRRHLSTDGLDANMRHFAWSYDGGETWEDLSVSNVLPDGPEDTVYGLMGGMVRLPVRNEDIIIFSNVKSPSGRNNGTVWASMDGGKRWSHDRRVKDGGFGYSSLAAGRPGTPSEGWIYLMYETGQWHESNAYVARFNLAWLLQGDQPLTWDSKKTEGADIGGDGVWTAGHAESNWYNGRINVGWPDSSTEGVFGGTPGTVTLSHRRSAGVLRFEVPGYVMRFAGRLRLESLSGDGLSETTFTGAPGAGGAIMLHHPDDLTLTVTITDHDGPTSYRKYCSGRLILAEGFAWEATGGFSVFNGRVRFAAQNGMPKTIGLTPLSPDATEPILELAAGDITTSLGIALRLGSHSGQAIPVGFDAIGADRTITLTNTADILWRDYNSGGGGGGQIQPYALILGTSKSEGKVTLQKSESTTDYGILLSDSDGVKTRTILTDNGASPIDAETSLPLKDGRIGTGAILKTGEGILALSGHNTYTGNTTIEAGTLLVNGTHTSAGSYIVNKKAAFGGTGNITLAAGESLVIQSNGTIAPGGGDIGRLTINGNVILSEDSSFQLRYRDAESSCVQVNGTLTLPSSATITLGESIGAFPVKVTLFTAQILAGETDISGWIVQGMENAIVIIQDNDVVLKYHAE